MYHLFQLPLLAEHWLRKQILLFRSGLNWFEIISVCSLFIFTPTRPVEIIREKNKSCFLWFCFNPFVILFYIEPESLWKKVMFGCISILKSILNIPKIIYTQSNIKFLGILNCFFNGFRHSILLLGQHKVIDT